MASRKILQFSLRKLMAYSVVFGIGAHALMNPTDLGYQVLFPATIFVFATGLLISRFGHPSIRPTAYGFSLFGITYLVLVILVGDLINSQDPGYAGLITDRVLDAIFQQIAEPPPPMNGNNFAIAGGGPYALHDPPGYLFWPTGHLVIAWGMALIGAAMGKLIHYATLSAISKSVAEQADERGAPKHVLGSGQSSHCAR